jgi:anti-sigma factor RsiW
MGSRIHPASRLEEDSTDCDRVADRLSDYLDGELDPSVARTIAVHLCRCPGCARNAAELALTIAALHRLSPARG